MMPVLFSFFARRMSSVVRTSVRISPYSRICCFISAMLSTVFWKLSQTDTVQFTAVTPPLRMSSNTERSNFEMFRPSMMLLSCKVLIVCSRRT
ncbi:hypothetical protein R75465_08490 [Paraburkholderia aspalathi]|nr:hypothetical protein R75465_08490 [Paraburkholderia aspalathi]